ncbi:MAG: methyltransferase domain-containing protein [Nitrospiraceae bacterium]
MRDNVKALVKAFAETFEVPEPIYEFGSLQIGPPGYADLRPYFPRRHYVGCDMRDGPGVDRIEELDRLSIPDKSVGTVITADTIEHVFPIFTAFEEMRRVLKDDGAIIVTSVMDFWIHSHPYDYWRFTPEAIEGLLKPYPLKVIGYQGLPDFPHTVCGIAFKSYHPDLERRCSVFCERVDRDLLSLERATHQDRSLNGKFKTARKRLTYKLFGPKSEYTKMVKEYKAAWKIITPGKPALADDGSAR